MTQDGFSVTHLCQALDVHRNGFYRWKEAPKTLHEKQDERLTPLVQQIFYQHRRRYGARRISEELTDRGESCCRAKARKIMEKSNLEAIQPKSFKPRTTESRHRLGYSPNLLLEGVELERINQVWVGDITYIPLSGRFAYLAMLMDLYSKRIVGWRIDINMEESLVMKALRMSIKTRQPPQGLIHHTDRGGQYAGKKYRKILERAKMSQSMSRAGDCYDNAFMESCFGTLKTEMEMTCFESFEKAKREIEEYINYYNIERRHSSIEYMTPSGFEASIVS